MEDAAPAEPDQALVTSMTATEAATPVLYATRRRILRYAASESAPTPVFGSRYIDSSGARSPSTSCLRGASTARALPAAPCTPTPDVGLCVAAAETRAERLQ